MSDFLLLKLSANRLSSIFRNLFVGIKVNEMMKSRCVYWHNSGEAKLKLKAESPSTKAGNHWPLAKTKTEGIKTKCLQNKTETSISWSQYCPENKIIV
jgi:hypothetical protein